MSDRRLAALLVLTALLARIVAWLGTPIFGTDSAQMMRMADGFFEGRWRAALEVGYHPLFPFLMSLLKPLAGTERAGFAISIALGSAAAAPLFLAARAAFGRPAAFLGTLLYAVHPSVVELHADVMTEGTFMFFLFTAVWLGTEAVEEPRWDRALLAGLAAGAAYLARPEGLLAVAGIPCWLLVSAWRGRRAARAGTAALALATALVVMSPYLLWARSVKGRWTLSAKGSVQAVEGAEERKPEATEKGGEVRVRNPWAELWKHLLRVTQIFLLPLLAVGFLGLRKRWSLLVYLSFPIVYWAAIVWATTRNPYTSYRYLLPGMMLLLPVAAAGVERLLRAIRRPAWWPAAAAALAVVLAARDMRTVRADERPMRAAAAWIREQGRPAPLDRSKAGPTGPAIVASTTDKVSYLAGSPYRPMPATWEEFMRTRGESDYVVYTDKELEQRKPPYLGRIREHLGDPVRFAQEKCRTVYVHRCR
ncbi:MAG: glycosyltransferase family 39 protein [Planctomycetes bacterium]|nr:glycosyltransferase family 39 protein [Planctomycetota bacterium]